MSNLCLEHMYTAIYMYNILVINLHLEWTPLLKYGYGIYIYRGGEEILLSRHTTITRTIALPLLY